MEILQILIYQGTDVESLFSEKSDCVHHEMRETLGIQVHNN